MASRPPRPPRPPQRSEPRPPRRAKAGGPGKLPVPTESALILGLLRDVLLSPLWLLGLCLGHRRARLQDGLVPLLRVQAFIGAAWMTALLVALMLLTFTVEVILRKGGLSEPAFLRYFALRREDLGQGHHVGLLLHVFSHASAAHLIGNLLALIAFGRVVERHLGPWRLLGAFVVSAIVSTLLSLGFQYILPGHPSVPTLGASGAVAGLVALGVLFEPFAITFEALLPMPLFLVGWLALAADLLALFRDGAGLMDQVDHPAHLGGYLSVSLYYFALDTRQRKRARAGLLLNFLFACTAFTIWHVLH
jgi:membrane associated rhomboid family serine protease